MKTGKMIKENMELVVLNLMFGRQINGRMLTLLILALFLEITDVQVKNVEMELTDKMEFVIKMVVI